MPVSIVDLFCGVGGLTKGLELAGLNVVAGLDFDESCKYAYEANNNALFLHRDITAVTGNEIRELFPEGHTQVLVGCAPLSTVFKTDPTVSQRRKRKRTRRRSMAKR